ncbi:hypothetical protein NEOKW01_1959 [Nematocida sp. AWRm80]|nr:hypothetical protein NEOKW01_1959 [Nematocida sp. AWRm80]
MRRATCTYGNILFSRIEEKVLQIEYSWYRTMFYLNGIQTHTLVFPSQIISISLYKNRAYILLKDGIHTYIYDTTNTIKRAIKKSNTLGVERVLKGVSDGMYMVIRQAIRNNNKIGYTNTLYNLVDYTKYVIDTIDRVEEGIDPRYIVSIRMISTTEVQIRYENTIQRLKYNQETTEWEKGPEENNKIYRIFIDKRNLIEITPETTNHYVLATTKVLLVGKTLNLTNTSTGVTIQADDQKYNLIKKLGRYTLELYSEEREEEREEEDRKDKRPKISDASSDQSIRKGKKQDRIKHSSELIQETALVSESIPTRSPAKEKEYLNCLERVQAEREKRAGYTHSQGINTFLEHQASSNRSLTRNKHPYTYHTDNTLEKDSIPDLFPAIECAPSEHSSLSVEWTDLKGEAQVFLDKKKYAAVLVPSEFISINGLYMHQVLSTGQVKVFYQDSTLIHIRTIATIILDSLVEVHGYSTHLSTVLVLIYTNRFVIIEYGTNLRLKSLIRHKEEIEEVRRYRKDIVVRCSDKYIKYHLDKQKNLQCTLMKDTQNIYSLTLTYQNMNARLLPVIIYKGIEYRAEVPAKKISVTSKFINMFHLLHVGYVYSTGSSIILSSGESVKFDISIRRLLVYNGIERSTILVHLYNYKVHLISIKNARIEGRMDLPYTISPNYIEMISLTSFYTIDRYTLTIYEGDAFIHPILRISLPQRIFSIMLSDKIYIHTENNLVYELDRIEDSLGVCTEENIGVSIDK